VTLSTAPIDFTSEFLYANGLDRLEVIMVKLAPLPKDKGDMNEQLVGEVLKCLRILMNLDVSEPCPLYFTTECQLGLSYVFDKPTLVAMVTYSLRLPTPKLRVLAADMLAAMSIISAHGHRLVLDGFSDCKITFIETFRFEWLVSSLDAFLERDREDIGTLREDDPSGENEIWEWRASALSLANALASGGEDLASRCELRGELRRRGLDHAIDVSPAPRFRRVDCKC
jgi:diaphanous 1